MTLIMKRVDDGTDPAQSSLVDAVAQLMKENYEEILRQLVACKILKKA